MPSIEPLVSVIVLNWNGKKYLNECLKSLENQSYSNIEIILVDNDSKDDSVQFTKEVFPKVKIIENEKNLGFAEGNNKGIKKAKGKYVFVINNDTETNENCLKNLVIAAERDKNIGMCAPKILSLGDYPLIDSVGMNIYFDGMTRGKGRNEIDKGQYNKKEEILLPSGCAALYRKEMLDEIGLFDKDFFTYCEDADLGLRGRLAGWQAIFEPNAIVYHHYSGTVGKYSSFKFFSVERNHFWVVLKNFPLRLIILLPLYTLLRYFFIIYALLKKKGPGTKFKASKISLFFILIKAQLSAIMGIPKMLKKRISIQKNKKITTKAFSNLIKRHSLQISEITLRD